LGKIIEIPIKEKKETDLVPLFPALFPLVNKTLK
jgi:hypothetical protein